MKILWLSHFVPYPPAGGALQRSYHLLRHTAATHDITLYALNQPRLLATQDQLREAQEALSVFCGSVNILPLPSEQSRAHWAFCAARSVLSQTPFDVSWLSSAEFGRQVEAAHRAGAFDLVHVDTIGLWPYVQGWLDLPRVLIHHNIESRLTARSAAHRVGIRRFLLARDAGKMADLEQLAGTSADCNVVVSTLDAESLHTIAPSAITEVVDNGVNCAYWNAIPHDGHDLIFAGTLDWFPNRDAVEFLLSEIWPIVRRQHSNRRLLLVGRNPPAQAQLAAESDPRVHVTGFVTDVRPFFAEAGICLCPIRVGGGTRLKILDALASGRPLVSTAIGVEGLELIEEVHYLRAETAQEFVNQIARLDNNPQLSRRLVEAGTELVRIRYDWNVVGLRLERAYERGRRHFTSTRHQVA